MVVKAIIFFYTYEKEIPIMKITYYGHSCFLVEENNSRILFDPYEDGSVPGFTLSKDICVGLFTEVFYFENFNEGNK